MKLEKFLQDNYNYNPDVKNNIQGYITDWKSWYEGNVKGFHNFEVFNGIQRVKQKRYTMNMAKEISEDWSDILWSEKCKISMNNEQNQEQFENLLNELDLNVIINQAIEKSGALGTVAAVASLYDIKSDEEGIMLDFTDSKARIDIVDIDWIFPLSWDNKEVKDCAFGSVEYRNGDKFVVLSVHKKEDDGNYHIYNHLFKDSKGNLTEIIDNNVIKDFNTNSDVKWFALFKPLLTNNLFENSPFGIPHYANAIDNIKSVDISFDALKTEVKDSKKRTFVREDLLRYDDGTQKMTFDPEATDIYVLPKGVNTKDALIQHDTEDLRSDKQIAALNTNLNILGNKVGFGENHYHFDGQNLSTATAVISSNSKLFRRKKKLEIGYESSIFDLVKAICYASNMSGQYNINTEDMVIQFDDSIIEDKESESVRALREVSAGLISKEEYRERVFGETPEIAEEKIRQINENNPSVQDLIGGEE